MNKITKKVKDDLVDADLHGVNLCGAVMSNRQWEYAKECGALL